MVELTDAKILKLLQECTAPKTQSCNYFRELGLNSVRLSRTDSGRQIFTGPAQGFNLATQDEVDRLANRYKTRPDLQDAVINNRESIRPITDAILRHWGPRIWVNGHFNNSFVLRCDEHYPRHLFWDDSVDRKRIKVYTFCWIIRRACRKIEDRKRPPQRASTEDESIYVPSSGESSQQSQPSQPSQRSQSLQPSQPSEPSQPFQPHQQSQPSQMAGRSAKAIFGHPERPPTATGASVVGTTTNSRGSSSISVAPPFRAHTALSTAPQGEGSNAGRRHPLGSLDVQAQQNVPNRRPNPTGLDPDVGRDWSPEARHGSGTPSDTIVAYSAGELGRQKRRLSTIGEESSTSFTALQQGDGANATRRLKRKGSSVDSSRPSQPVLGRAVSQAGTIEDISVHQGQHEEVDRVVEEGPQRDSSPRRTAPTGTRPSMIVKLKLSLMLAASVGRNRFSLAQQLWKLSSDEQQPSALDEIARLTKILIGTDSSRLRDVFGDDLDIYERVISLWLGLIKILEDFRKSSAFRGTSRSWQEYFDGLTGKDRMTARDARFVAIIAAHDWKTDCGDAFHIQVFSRNVTHVLVTMADWKGMLNSDDEEELNKHVTEFNEGLLAWFG